MPGSVTSRGLANFISIPKMVSMVMFSKIAPYFTKDIP